MTKELVEKVARAMCVARGMDPDQLHKIGYGDTEQTLPYWKMQVEWAERHIAAVLVLKEEGIIA